MSILVYLYKRNRKAGQVSRGQLRPHEYDHVHCKAREAQLASGNHSAATGSQFYKTVQNRCAEVPIPPVAPSSQRSVLDGEDPADPTFVSLSSVTGSIISECPHCLPHSVVRCT